MDFIRPLRDILGIFWILLGHYVFYTAIMGRPLWAVLHQSYSISTITCTASELSSIKILRNSQHAI